MGVGSIPVPMVVVVVKNLDGGSTGMGAVGANSAIDGEATELGDSMRACRTDLRFGDDSGD